MVSRVRKYLHKTVLTGTVFVALALFGGCGGGVATQTPKTNSTQVPTSNDQIGVDVGFSPLGISVRQRVDQSSPIFTLTPKDGQRTTVTVDLTGFGETMDVIVEDQPFTTAVYPGDKTIASYGETYCLMVVDVDEAVEKPCGQSTGALPQPVTIEFGFDPKKTPAGFTPAEATVMFYDGTKWWDIGATVDPATGKIRVNTTQTNLLKVVFRHAPAPGAVSLTGVRLEAPQSSLMEGETSYLRAYATYSDNTLREITQEAAFVISDPSRALLVGNNGVRAISAGQTTVIASFDGKNSQVETITILDEAAPAPVVTLNAQVMATGSQVFLSWTLVGDVDVSFYEVYQSSQPFAALSESGVALVGKTSSAFSSTFTFGALANGTYYFAVVAVDDSGNRNGTPGSVATVSLLDHTAPPVVNFSFAPKLGNGAEVIGVVLDWSGYTNSDAVKFTIRRSLADFTNVNDGVVVADNLTGKSYEDLTANTPGTYFYAVIAIDASGNQLTDLPAGTVKAFTF